MRNLFNKLLKRGEETNSDSSLAGTSKSLNQNWYSDRYETVLTQRNFLVAISILSFIAVIIAIGVVGKISISKTFSPFVIQIEERTGSAKIVNPANSSLLSGNEALTRYFVKKYLIARETYNPVDFETNVKKIVRLYSTQLVFRDFIGYIKSPQNDPTILYAQRNTTYLRIKSFAQLDKKYFVRFSVVETVGDKRVYDKIATISIDYVAMELTEDERDINPVGFQVTGYRVDDDNS